MPRIRTQAGNITAAARRRYGNERGAFPIADRRSAQAALNLRGHARSRTERLDVIHRAARFLPRKAEDALRRDLAAGEITRHDLQRYPALARRISGKR